MESNEEKQSAMQSGDIRRGVAAILALLLVIGAVWYGSQSWMYNRMKQAMEAGDYTKVHERYHSKWWMHGRWEPTYWDAYCEWKLACENQHPLAYKKRDAAVDAMMEYMVYDNGEMVDLDADGLEPTVVAITRELDELCRVPYEEGLRLLEQGAYEDAGLVFKTVSHHYGNLPFWKDVARYMAVYPEKVQRYQGKAVENFKLLKTQYQPKLSAREQEVLNVCSRRIWEETDALKKVLQAQAEASRKAEAERVRHQEEERLKEIKRKYPSLSQADIVDCENIMKYPHKGMKESQVQDTPFGTGHKWNVGRNEYGWDVDCYTFKKGGQTICYAYVSGGVVTKVNIFHEDVCDFFPWHAELILNGERDPYDLRNELNNSPKFVKNQQKNGTSSGGSSSNKGSGSSGSKAHGFVGSEDEWEDYDDYMDDYEYWEHKDVDDMDDWEDDWDEDWDEDE